MFQLDLTESLEREIRRVAVGELKDADSALTDDGEPLAGRVHEARKRLKRLRAVLALVDDNAPRETLDAIAAGARAAAHCLAAPRGYAALLQRFEEMVGKNPAGDSSALRTELEAQNQRATSSANEYLAQARERVREARKAAKELEVSGEGFSIIAQGFRKTYRKAQRALAVAQKQGSASDFHAFRTPSKRHFYQLRLLECAWPVMLEPQAGAVDELGELLGEHHDLCLLALELAKVVENDAERELSQAIDQRIRELEKDALRRGARCFVEQPSAITQRIGRYYALSMG